jgi:hypothetical protein
MTDQDKAEGFTPLPPIIRKSPSYDSDEDRGFDIEDRAPKGKASKSYKKKTNHKRTDSKMSHEPEFIEVPSSPRRFRETEAERARRRAERDAADAFNVATQNADAAFEERKRRLEVESLGRKFERAYIGERDVRLDAVREAQEAKARADELAKQLHKEKREKRYLEREAEVLAREKRVAEEQERITRTRTVLRPVDLHHEPRPNITRDPGGDAIRRAQEDARRREQNHRDDDLLFGHQREQRRGHGRRWSKIIFEDDLGRRGHRRE